MPQRTVPTPRLILAWAVMLGGLVGCWLCRPLLGTMAWMIGEAVVLFTTSKFATLLCMASDERRRLPWKRFVAYLFWPGMRPSHFLPERTPADVRPAPTVRGMLLNTIIGVTFLWVMPALMPGDWPLLFRLSVASAGFAWLLLFAFFDALSLLYRASGIGVEKLWHCPIASTSLAEFWGQRWNRIFSGMLREILFLPLARRASAGVALAAVFVYSGLLHENFSFAAESGYGGPFLYFAVQGAATWLEGRRTLRRLLQSRPWLGWLWTAAVVLGPVTLLAHEGWRENVIPPLLASVGVPGVQAPDP